MTRIFMPPLAPQSLSAKIDPILQADDLRILKSHLKPKAEKTKRRRPSKLSELIAEARAARSSNPYR